MSTPFFDAHTHVQFAAYDADREEVIRRAQDANVWMMNVGTSLKTSEAAVSLANRFEKGIYAAAGIHPVHATRSFYDMEELGASDDAKALSEHGEVFAPASYRTLAGDPKTVAIGECGLDYFRLEGDLEEIKAKQRAMFEAQIEFAHEVRKPLMIHCRAAFRDLIDTLKENRSKLKTSSPGVIHFFSGSLEEAKQLLEMGFAFTFGGAITFPPRKGESIGTYDEVVRYLPLEAILSETDAPYVAPVPYRGKRNEPAYVVEVVRRLAELKAIEAEEMEKRIFENARHIFGIAPA